jgi:hypothetical protein
MPESCFFFSKIPIHFFLNNLLTKQPPSLASDLPRKASFLQNGVGKKLFQTGLKGTRKAKEKQSLYFSSLRAASPGAP